MTRTEDVFQDFTYGNDYFETWVLQGAGGAALESHDFSHLDCPLTPMKKSGYFVLAKWMNDARTDIEITAFQVMDIPYFLEQGYLSLVVLGANYSK